MGGRRRRDVWRGRMENGDGRERARAEACGGPGRLVDDIGTDEFWTF